MSNLSVIESIENKLGEYLISIIPVSWDKIVFYAKSTGSATTIRYAFREKETLMTITSEFMFRRYPDLTLSENDIDHTLFEYTEKLYNAYREEIGEDKVWRTMAYVIEEDGSYHIDLSYEMPQRNMREERNWLVETYFGDKYTQLKGLYPSTEIEFRAE